MCQSRLSSSHDDGLTVPLASCPAVWGAVLSLVGRGDCVPLRDGQAWHHQAEGGASTCSGVDLGRCLGTESTKRNAVKRRVIARRSSRQRRRGPGSRNTACHQDMVVDMSAGVHHALNTAHFGDRRDFRKKGGLQRHEYVQMGLM